MLRIVRTTRASLADSRMGYNSRGLAINSSFAFVAKPAVILGLQPGYARVALRQAAHIHNHARNRYSSPNQQYRQPEEDHKWQQHNQNPNNGRGVSLLKPVVWAFAFSAGVFYICSIVFVRQPDNLPVEPVRQVSIRSMLLGDAYSDQQVLELMNDSQVQALVGKSHRVNGIAHARTIQRIARLPLPHWVTPEPKLTLISLVDQWYSLSRSKRCVYGIVGINAAVFCMWRIPRLLPLMARSFLHDPRKGRAYTMFTSTFSHREFLHFAFNNYVLVSFGTTVALSMGPEQFTAFYLTAGVFASLASQILTPILPGLILPSLGASGAIYSIIGAATMMYPNQKVNIVFLPSIPISLSTLFSAFMAYDFIGIVRGWTAYGHVAHFAGGLFGIAYAWWGKDVWTRLVLSAKARRMRESGSNRPQ